MSFTLHPFRIAALCIGITASSLCTGALIQLLLMQSTLEKASTVEQIAASAGFTPTSIEQTIGFDSILSRLPESIQKLVPDLSSVLSSDEKARLDRLLHETTRETFDNVIAQAPAHIRDPSLPINVQINLLPVRKELLSAIQNRLGSLLTSLLGDTVRAGVETAIPEKLPLPGLSREIEQHLQPLCDLWKKIQRWQFNVTIACVLSFLLLLLAAVPRLFRIVTTLGATFFFTSLLLLAARASLLSFRSFWGIAVPEPLIVTIGDANLAIARPMAAISAVLLIVGAIGILVVQKRAKSRQPQPETTGEQA